MRLLPPVYFLAAITLMSALHLYLPVADLVRPPWNLVGIAAVLPGLALVAHAARLFHKHGTAIKPFQPATTLVTIGPYRYTRNPMYLGMCLILGGIALGLGTATPWLVIPVFIWLITSRFITREERCLADRFGGDYTDYRARVRRWI